MANIKSQKKRIVTTEKSRQRNRACKSELKTAVRAAREAVAAGDATAAYAKALYACRLLDKAASKGIIHKNQAANRKSGIMNLVNTIVTDDVRAAYVKPEAKKQESNGNKKAARKAERIAAMKAASEAKALRRAEQLKQEAAAAERKAKAAAEAAAALTDYAKIANEKARPKQDWQVKDHVSCARRFTADELRAALISARNTEQAMKSGADPDAAFREWVVGVTAKRR